MNLVPISSYTINLILHYISPPSQLLNPIPSDLLSLSLLKRHTLLEISPTDSSSYLTWPSSFRGLAIQHLEHLPMPLDELDPNFLVGYTVDPEHAYAHVHLTPTGENGLRLVFEWDGQETWKYHDSNVMPFPPGAHTSLSDAVASAATVVIPVPELGREKLCKGPNGDGDNGDDDNDNDDDYWNSYGARDASSVQLSPLVNKDDEDASEDAYWAQYASVQGTADSTVPSPVHRTTRRLQSVPIAHHISNEGTLLTLAADVRPHLHDPRAPPSPNTLTNRLTALSPRPSVTNPLSDGFPHPDPEEDIPEATDDDIESPSSLLDVETTYKEVTLRKGPDEHISSAPVAIKTDAIRGLFLLWKATRRGSNSTPERTREASTDELDKADFLQLVVGY
ncbi:hypothetical protein B0F90DRAFT_69731 [Multifurca ochricompacta]|uniref:Uncharacterized protein n=1 Tax=Multifurca ochricompacta TaxID=376703 RepID=A0AAD4MCX0_9AGAM|nr:hypothetical protein B0F90DRAFT_69731 [Multifurca ochricompacta]